jgi:hypothetical protein
MSEDNESKITRVLSPSPLVNWARQNLKRFDETRKRVWRIAENPPRHSLAQVNSICADIACRRLLPSKVEERIAEIENPFARVSAREVVPAFFGLARERKFDGIQTPSHLSIALPIGRGPDGKPLLIPLRPTFILIENNQLTPIFMIGWAKLALQDYQKQLISTVLEHSYLSLQDYVGRHAEILCFPRIPKTRHRHSVSWRTNEIDLLSEDQVRDQFDCYSRAVIDVVKELRGT